MYPKFASRAHRQVRSLQRLSRAVPPPGWARRRNTGPAVMTVGRTRPHMRAPRRARVGRALMARTTHAHNR